MASNSKADKSSLSIFCYLLTCVDIQFASWHAFSTSTSLSTNTLVWVWIWVFIHICGDFLRANPVLDRYLQLCNRNFRLTSTHTSSRVIPRCTYPSRASGASHYLWDTRRRIMGMGSLMLVITALHTRPHTKPASHSRFAPSNNNITMQRLLSSLRLISLAVTCLLVC